MSFKEFSQNAEYKGRAESLSVANSIKSEINVSEPRTFTKLFGVHLGTAAITLSVCPQFGLSPINTGINLFEAFMFFGHAICSVLCGLFFIGTSLGASYLFLNFDEWRVFKKNYWKFGAGLVALSLVGFATFDADFQALHLELWVLGTIIALYTLHILNLRPALIKESL